MPRRRASLARSFRRTRRQLTLLGAFVLVSAVILTTGALVLGTALGRALRDQRVTKARRTAERYVDAALRPSVVRDGRIQVAPAVPAAVREDFARRQADVVSVKVWSPDGTLAWTRLQPNRIGRRYTMSAGLRGALRRGATSSEFVSSVGADDRAERDAEARAAPARLLEVYTPIRAAN